MVLYYFWRWSCLILLGLLVYGQTFQFGFVFDDRMFVVDNPYIKNFNHVYLIWHTYPMTRSLGFYSFALNYFFNQLNPQGYHIFNLMVHFLATGLVWALAGVLFRITKISGDRLTREVPFIIAVLFLVHPCQTQAVSYISQRFESMATVFYLGTMYCYLSARISTDRVHKIMLFGLSGFFTVLGILTKEVVITVPAMMLASEWILFDKKNTTRLYIVLAVGGILLYILFTKFLHTDLSIFLRSIVSDSHQGDVLTPVRYFLTQMRVFLTFLRLLVLPIHQNLDYDYPVSTGLLHPPLTLVGLSTIGGIVALTIKLRRSFPLIAFGLAWVLITFSINLAPRANVIFEHKLYLISFGFFLVLVVTLSILVRNRRLLMWIFLCMTMVLALLSFQRNKIWKEQFTLWNDTVQKSPHKARPYGNRGLAYYNQGHFTQAMSDYNKAIEINPNYTEAYNNRGNIYYDQGHFTQAMSDYNKAIEINPGYEKAYSNRGAIYEEQGQFTQALSDFNKANEINPDNIEAYINRGVIDAEQGKFTEALSNFNRAIEIDPNNIKAVGNRGLTYYRQGNLNQAMADDNRAVALDANDTDAYNNRGVIYANQGNLTQAILDYNKAIEINPNYAQAYVNRGKIYWKQGNLDQAIADYNKAILLNPDYANAYKYRAIAYDQLRKYDDEKNHK